jgi:hypothetical protein
MIDPFVELGGWMIHQAIEDVLGKDEVEEEEQNEAWNFLLNDPIVEQILSHIDYRPHWEMTKREWIIRVFIPQRALEFASVSPQNEVSRPSRPLAVL